jgi:two-component system response regulator HydG
MSGASLGRVLVVDDEVNIGESIKEALQRTGYAVEFLPGAEPAWDAFLRETPDVVLCDVRMRPTDGFELLRRIKEASPEVPVVMITAYGSIEAAVAAMKLGAADYLLKPFRPEDVRQVVARVLQQKNPPPIELPDLFGERVVIGRSAAMRRLFEVTCQVAPTESGVLVTGETGTGKEVLARVIHARSRRRERPFVTVNCAAIPPNLLESELFGHRRGAFTGALYNRRGSFELADGGTLFLDEIGDMPVDMQVKILRALEERQVKRVGSEEPIAVDNRIIAATNKDLIAEIKAGRFREDLYWRLNVVNLVVPPLRDRPEDVLLLARHFLDQYARDLKRAVAEFSEPVVEALTAYPWPGNVRELRNAVERAIIFAEAGKPIRLGHLPAHLQAVAPRPETNGGPAFVPLRDLELSYIRKVVEACGGNRTRAAGILGLSPVTLWRKLGKEGAAES